MFYTRTPQKVSHTFLMIVYYFSSEEFEGLRNRTERHEIVLVYIQDVATRTALVSDSAAQLSLKIYCHQWVKCQRKFFFFKIFSNVWNKYFLPPFQKETLNFSNIILHMKFHTLEWHNPIVKWHPIVIQIPATREHTRTRQTRTIRKNRRSCRNLGRIATAENRWAF